MKQTLIRPQLVEFIPEILEDGILYISQRYRTATHRCCCGCSMEVVTPLGPTDWSLQISNGEVTLYPSIGNWSLPCKSHYWIRNGKVMWSASMTQHQIELGRKRDQRLRDAYFAEINHQKDAKHHNLKSQKISDQNQPIDRQIGVWKSFKKWLGLDE